MARRPVLPPLTPSPGTPILALLAAALAAATPPFFATPTMSAAVFSRWATACAGLPVTRSHSRIALSSEPVASVLLSGAHARHDTPAMWPTSVSRWAPVDASQILAVPSADAEAIQRPSGEMRTWETAPAWPWRRRCWW
ncbi:hypothetical protein CHGG_01872 [Chaetomium globosum CBS 148.51]|uniref:Uncharacterized protein n=1 Tax=Chaetomium globosum (strain ATCC 6205 / CBS 148.51 / DSM 1962 / NBRC 6347 / NRRL 1970) TaxID=306901 RepID=Q2HD32_CHAGB|nr:uncharacterized protein CHGG_01872 [Chaetomium globosum CBS 148.51]EAQ93637.1 hypothetical protein CHGG_01872 [Chaetomium globosum CBS 148.51]